MSACPRPSAITPGFYFAKSDCRMGWRSVFGFRGADLIFKVGCSVFIAANVLACRLVYSVFVQ